MLFAVEVALYSALPFLFVLLNPQRRLLSFYFYLGLVHTVGGLLSAVFVFRLTDSIVLSAGSVAYGALLMATLMLVMVASDVQVVRNVIALVVVANIFKFAIFTATAAALRSGEFPNPHGTPPELFDASLRVVVVGGLLIIVELLAMLAIFERLSPHVSNTMLRSALQVAAYVVILSLDGVLFPVLVFTDSASLGELIRHGVAAKFVLALAYAIPLLAFLLLFRNRIGAYNNGGLRLHDVFLAPREDLLRKLHDRETALRRSEARLAETLGNTELRKSIAAALATIDTGADMERKLAELGRALQPNATYTPGLVVLVDDEPISVHGHRLGNFVTSAADRRTLGARGPWLEQRTLGSVVCVPVAENDAVVAVVELSTEPETPDVVLERARELRYEVGALLRPDIAEARERWSRRQSIVSILRTRSLRACFQPIVRLDDHRVHAYEGLTRFEPGVSTEGRFREAARLGLGAELDLLAAQTILESARALPDARTVTVNVSPATILDSRFAVVLAAADRDISIEITEHDRVEDYRALVRALARLPSHSFGVDDVGSGYASMQHILRLEPSYVKLDRALVTAIDHDPSKQALVRGLLGFLAETGTDVVAEGIETGDEARALGDLGVGYGQGYFFGRPAPAAELINT